jgi:hypothetical protein
LTLAGANPHAVQLRRPPYTGKILSGLGRPSIEQLNPAIPASFVSSFANPHAHLPGRGPV